MAKPLAVLIVEDSESDAQLIVRLLKKAGYNLTFEQVENAAQMRAALEKPTWDVVISDYSLPEFDGHTALMLLQETGLDIPFIAVSGGMGEETAVDMMKAGAHDYVMKSNLARLAPAVERELIQAEVRREHRQADEKLRETNEILQALVQASPVSIVALDLDGKVKKWNPASEHIFGWSEAEVLGQFLPYVPQDKLDESEALRQRVLGGEAFTNLEVSRLKKDGSSILVNLSSVPLHDCNGKISGIMGVNIDITERKRAEEALRESETRFRSLFENSLMGISTATLDGHLIEANLAYAQMYGYRDPDEMKSEVSDIGHQLYAHPEERQEVLQIIAETGFMKPREMELVRRDGTRFFALVSARGVKDAGGKLLYYQANHIDITERKQAEKALRESEEKFRNTIQEASDGIVICDEQFRIVEWNKSEEAIFGLPRAKMVGTLLWDFQFDMLPEDKRNEEYYQRLKEVSLTIGQPESAAWMNRATEMQVVNAFGEIKTVLFTPFVISTQRGSLYASLTTDITERKRAEKALQQSEAKFRSYIEHAPLGVFIVDRLGRYVEGNAAATEILGYTEAELLRLSIPDVLAPQSLEAGLQQFQSVVQGGFSTAEFLLRRKDGSQFWATVDAVRLSEDRFMSYCQDITERKQAEEKLVESKALVDAVVENVPLMIFLKEAKDQRFVLFNHAGEELLGYDREALLGKNDLNLFPPEQAVYFMAKDREVLDGEMGMLDIPEEPILTAKKGQRLLHTQKICIRGSDGATKYLLGISEDITERKQAEVEIRQNLSELKVLYQSSMAFNQLIDPKTIAEKVIDLLDQEMAWHHTAIRLYHPESDTLELLAFNLPYLKNREEHRAAEKRFKVIQRPSQGLSGWVIQHGQAVCSNDLKNDPRYFETFPGLQSGLYVPIKIGKQVIGVISIESEQAQAFNESNERLAITLAEQAAIAMNNAQLFEGLKRSNIDLALAYDATIEGWSRALDLRDKETEGHSQRVTDMTLRLAQSMGLSRKELVHVRRGALLHDIGKLGVPDGILFKPGPLTPEEWVVMKKHPTFAYEMLAPIHYLQPALAIPHCHHEKWDGSGYPRGLIGSQIPLAARIFAVADVWDALKSDRPYRPGWAEEKVYEHIQRSAGTHFDPQVVDVFMQMPRNIPSTPVP